MKYFKNHKYYFFVFVFLLFIGCNSSQEKTKNENFQTYFKKFGDDSAFQFSRIDFPLYSIYYDYDGDTISKEYTKDSWDFVNIGKLENDFIIDTKNIGDTMFLVNFQMDDTGFFVDYIFRNINRKWYLVKIEDKST